MIISIRISEKSIKCSKENNANLYYFFVRDKMKEFELKELNKIHSSNLK